MENATKALLIAGAVLIVILVIAFGVGILNLGFNSGNSDEAVSEIKAGIDAGVEIINSVIK